MRRAALALSMRFAALTFVAALVAPRTALADPEISAHASAREVEVGEPFTVEVKALVERGATMPSDPQLRAPAGLTVVSGPSVSTQMQTMISGGRATTQLGIGATWQLVADKPGRYTIAAPTITFEGQKLRSSPIQINVVPATGRPRSSPRNPFLLPGGPLQGAPWPFGGPGSPFGRSPFDDDSAEAEEQPDENRALAMPSAPAQGVFLRAIADKTNAVIGEQVTLSIYLYFRDNQEMGEPHAAPAPDFLRYPLLEDPRSERASLTRVGDQRYLAQLIDKIALFPLKVGDLHTGSMQLRFTGRRVGARALRESNDVVIHVKEPPLDYRPPGYALGDVGRFTVTAAVQPRQIEEGGSVAVTVRVAGTGNFPQSLHMPERTGLEWLDPEKRESIEPHGGVIGGFRSFGYVVRIRESGAVDLGTVELPRWDPDEKRYVVERAVLGKVQVTPLSAAALAAAGASSASGASGASGSNAARSEPLAAMPAARAALGASTPPGPPPRPLDGAPFWFLLATPPMLVTLFGAGERVVRRLRARRAAGADSPATLAALAQREAEAAAARGDLKETAAAVERALHRAIEAATGLRSRGVLFDALPGELAQRDVPEALASGACALLAACEAIRFEPAGQASDASNAADLAERARAVTTGLGRWKPT